MNQSVRAKPIIWMFSGQGSQYYQMGKELYGKNQSFRYWMDRLDQVAIAYVGQSIIEMLYDQKRAKSDPFDEILFTHPALFMVQYALAKTLLAEGFSKPDYLFGASLGEFVAAAVSEVAEVDVMLFDIIKQARLFEGHCSGGAMLMVVHEIESFYTNPVFAQNCELAGVNFSRCFVVSGLKGDLLRIAQELAQQNITHQMLPVPVAFHSSLVNVVEGTFKKIFVDKVLNAARIPILSCARVQADQMAWREEGNCYSWADWWRVIRQPIQFKSAIEAIAQRFPEAVYLDSGPSGTMATFARYNLPKAKHGDVISLITPFGNDTVNLNDARDKLRALNSTSLDAHL
jgi:acyl transferase domain-containing protein